MLPRDLLRKEPDATAKRLAARGVSESVVGDWLKLDEQRRSLLVQLEELKRQRNDASKSIGQLKKEGKDADQAIAAVAGLKGQIEDLDSQVGTVDEGLAEIEASLPNVAHESVPVGPTEDDNRVERLVGDPTRFDFEAKAHWDLGPDLGILDFEEGAKLAGARFTVYRGVGARLERALANFMLDVHNGQHGYTEVLPPYMANTDSLFASGQLPKFEEDLFKTGEGLYLIPTAEVALVNLHRGEVLEEKQLPIRYAAWTPCFRSEAGSYGKDVRGLIRQHQFHKVELVQLTTEETSWQAHEELTGHAEKILELLELPYRVVTLSTGDMGFAASKTYDLEVWLPGQETYREISSCSNTGDFQARRANIRYRPEEGGKPRFVHALNGSGLAVGRTLIAVLENYQQADGTVLVPEVLRPYLGGLETIVGP